MVHNGSYTYAYFFWIFSPIKMKLCQILVSCLTNISNMFSAQCWRLETSSRPFRDFIKMTIGRDLAIFNSWHLPLLIVPYSPLKKLKHWKKKMKHWNLDMIGYWVIWAGCLIKKDKRTWNLAQSSKLFKIFLKIVPLAYIHQLTKFGDLLSCGSKNIVKNAPCLMC